MRYVNLIPPLSYDGCDFGRIKVMGFHVGALRPDGLRTCPRVWDDEIFSPVQIGEPFLPVVWVALELQAGAADVLLQFEGPSAHSVRFVPVDVLIEILLGVDEVGRMS